MRGIASICIMIILLLPVVSNAQERREEFRDANGHFMGTAITRGDRTEYRDRFGHFQGSSIRQDRR